MVKLYMIIIIYNQKKVIKDMKTECDYDQL